jgi:hypothetical protein
MVFPPARREGKSIFVMLLIIEFPLSDSRSFVDSDTQYLGYPVWPIPKPDRDFVRCFGAIRKRWRGGLSGWVSENLVCEADRALRFKRPLIYRHRYYTTTEWGREARGVSAFAGVAYRRFYFDGQVVAKFEVGIWLDVRGATDELSNKQIESVFQHFLKIPVAIPNPNGVSFECPLYKAGGYLASLYLLASTRTQDTENQEVPSWWVQSCEPILFLTQDDAWRHLDIPFAGKSISLETHISGELSHHFIPLDGYRFRFWNFHEMCEPWYVQPEWDFSRPKYYETEARSKARELRIFLLRLHAEKECLKQVLRNIAQKRILVSRNTDASDRLQYYLNIATRRIARLESASGKLIESDVGELAREFEDFVLPGEVDSIIATLRNLDIRKNILHKVEKYLGSRATIIMGDQYIVGQAGAVGPGAHAQNMTFTQIGSQIERSIDLSQLADELSKLHQAMKEEATEADHDIAVGDVAKAEQAAKAKEAPKVAEYLKSAGKWALDVATKIGTPLAIEALKQAIIIK